MNSLEERLEKYENLYKALVKTPSDLPITNREMGLISVVEGLSLTCLLMLAKCKRLGI